MFFQVCKTLQLLQHYTNPLTCENTVQSFILTYVSKHIPNRQNLKGTIDYRWFNTQTSPSKQWNKQTYPSKTKHKTPHRRSDMRTPTFHLYSNCYCARPNRCSLATRARPQSAATTRATSRRTLPDRLARYRYATVVSSVYAIQSVQYRVSVKHLTYRNVYASFSDKF